MYPQAMLIILVIAAIFASARVVNGETLKNYTYGELQRCALTTVELATLGPDDELEPCIISEAKPDNIQQIHEDNSTSVLAMVQVTPSYCTNHRDGALVGAEQLNADNDGKGVAIGFNQDHFVKFHFVGVVAGNPANLSQEEYDRRHDALLRELVTTLEAPYIVGTCSFASAVEKAPARDLQAIVMAQVGPPGFYTEKNPYVFGFHINSDSYPLPNVQVLDFLADEAENGGPEDIPVRVIYRTQSEFFYSTCRSAIDKLKASGFTDLIEILYDHQADNDGDGDINQFDDDFLTWMADQACPPGSGEKEDFHPALFLCTLTEQDVIIRRWLENGCRPVSTWVTAATWGWANNNLNMVPYMQGGGQWHPAFKYSDRYFESGQDLLIENEIRFGYLGNYDQVVSYAIPVLYSQHLQVAYRVADKPDPVADFRNDDRREQLRRDMIVLNVETIFGPVSFNEFQRNIGRGAAGSQWLPLNEDDSFTNALVSPFLQAEASTVMPASSALKCEAGQFVDESLRVSDGSLLASGCMNCPVDFFNPRPSQRFECKACPGESSTDGEAGQEICKVQEDNLLPLGIKIFGYAAVGITWTLSLCFMVWLVRHRTDPVVKVSQMEFMLLICIGAIISSSTIIFLSFEASSDEDPSLATTGCMIAPFLYSIGWVLQYSSLMAKTFRLRKVMLGNNKMQRVKITALQMSRIIFITLGVDMAILIAWAVLAPLTYERTEIGTDIDHDDGLITINSVGRCAPSHDFPSVWIFAGLWIGHHFILMIVTNVLLMQVRSVTDRYQEQKYVALASMLILEILLVGVPVLVAVNVSAVATFIVLTAIIAFNDIGILCFIFIPKIYFQWKGLEEGVGFGESIMKESKRKASIRQASFRSNGASSYGASSHASSAPETTQAVLAQIQGMTRSELGISGFSSCIDESIIEETSEDLKGSEPFTATPSALGELYDSKGDSELSYSGSNLLPAPLDEIIPEETSAELKESEPFYVSKPLGTTPIGIASCELHASNVNSELSYSGSNLIPDKEPQSEQAPGCARERKRTIEKLLDISKAHLEKQHDCKENDVTVANVDIETGSNGGEKTGEVELSPPIVETSSDDQMTKEQLLESNDDKNIDSSNGLLKAEQTQADLVGPEDVKQFDDNVGAHTDLEQMSEGEDQADNPQQSESSSQSSNDDSMREYITISLTQFDKNKLSTEGEITDGQLQHEGKMIDDRPDSHSSTFPCIDSENDDIMESDQSAGQ